MGRDTEIVESNEQREWDALSLSLSRREGERDATEQQEEKQSRAEEEEEEQRRRREQKKKKKKGGEKEASSFSFRRRVQSSSGRDGFTLVRTRTPEPS